MQHILYYTANSYIEKAVEVQVNSCNLVDTALIQCMQYYTALNYGQKMQSLQVISR